jgi:hypothetical protein
MPPRGARCAPRLAALPEQRGGWAEDFLRAAVTDATVYHAVYNNDTHGVVEIAHSIFAHVTVAWKTREAPQ